MNNGSNFDIGNMNNMLNLVKLLSSAPGNPTPQTNPHIELDHLVSNQQMNMIKASLPYLDVNKQKNLAIIIKYLELKKTMTLYGQNNLHAISDIQKSNTSKRDMLYALRAYCPDKLKQQLDIILNMQGMLAALKNPAPMYQEPHQQGGSQSNQPHVSPQDDNLNREELIQQLKHLMQN
ncbi:hypothetical protein HZI73_11430 [Vallitalea pronyensis]|uniref:Uncharacterized protein n=1 Tax=Vallitalea pronyensis TaxID=1348613 RepID=A0A8J8MKA0_9FIRM|nr:hypothetical protein [Vallitalea pronyensis]QUI22863.1 hypothetical protein HZI73_11430 [Vallitalea pronyensis]